MCLLEIKYFKKATFASPMAILLTLMLLIAMLPFATAHSGNTMNAPPLTVTPTIDGIWNVSVGEWADALQYNITGPGGTGYIRVKYDSNYLYIIIDSVWDTTESAAYYYENTWTAFDTSHDGGTAPQTDDHLFNNGWSYFKGKRWQGSGTRWRLKSAPAGYLAAQSGAGLAEPAIPLQPSPNSATPHRIDEVRIPLAYVGSIGSTGGFYVLVVDDTTGNYVEWPATAGGNPEGWPPTDPCPPPNNWGDLTLLAAPQPPVANFTYTPDAPLVDETVTFDASLSEPDGGNITSYLWDFETDGTIDINTTNPITYHAYNATGTYNVTLTVTDTEGLSNTTWKLITIYAPPVANFTYWPEFPVVGENVTFNATTSFDPDGSIVSYFWTFGDNTTGTGTIITHAYADDGIYNVTLTVTDNDNLTNSISKSITVLNKSPVAIFEESAETVLTSEPIYFNASLSFDPDGSIVSYFWTFGDGTNATGAIVNHAYSDDGTYTVTLTVTDDDGASSSVNATKTVQNRSPVANFTWSPDVPPVNQIVTFNASASYDPDGSIVSYFWTFGDGTNATGSEPIINHTYTMTGGFNVTLTVTDDDGATDLTMGTLTVSGRDVAVLNITVTYPYGATAAYPSWNITVSVSVRNEGPQNETFWVALYYNLTSTQWEMIGNETVTDLAAGAEKQVTFVWDTTGVSPSIYTFNATASAVPYEVDTADNVLVDGVVWLKIPGDADGDGHVQLSDLTILALNWYKPVIDPRADFTGDGHVTLADLTILALNWYKI